MKYTIECDSFLMQKALESFLDEFLSPEGVIITDKQTYGKNAIVVGRDIKKPFSKSQLLMFLEKNYIKYENPAKNSLEEKLERLTNEFVHNVVTTVKEEYGKKQY